MVSIVLPKVTYGSGSSLEGVPVTASSSDCSLNKAIDGAIGVLKQLASSEDFTFLLGGRVRVDDLDLELDESEISNLKRIPELKEVINDCGVKINLNPDGTMILIVNGAPHHVHSLLEMKHVCQTINAQKPKSVTHLEITKPVDGTTGFDLKFGGLSRCCGSPSVL